MSSTEQARWFVLGGDHLVLLDERGQIPQGPRACLPAHLHSAHFESFDEWDGLPCYLLDLGPDAESPPLAGLRQLMVAGDEEGFRLAGRAWQLATFRRHGDRDVVADVQREAVVGVFTCMRHMQDRPVLNVRAGADADVVHVAAHDHAGPERGIIAEFDIADQVRARIDVDVRAEAREDALVGSDVHGSEPEKEQA